MDTQPTQQHTTSVREYSQDYDSHMAKWLDARGLPPQELPENGLIVPYVCAGFIRIVEGGYGIAESYISNPGAPSSLRNEMLNKLMAALIVKAKDMGLKGLMAFSVDKNTIERAQRHGYAVVNSTLLSVTL